jgi:hypothetical protein
MTKHNVFITSCILSVLFFDAFGAASIRVPQQAQQNISGVPVSRAGSLRVARTGLTTTAKSTTPVKSVDVVQPGDDTRIPVLTGGKSISMYKPGSAAAANSAKVDRLEATIEDLKSQLDDFKDDVKQETIEGILDNVIESRNLATKSEVETKVSEVATKEELASISNNLPTVDMSDGTVNLKGANNAAINMPVYWLYYSDSGDISQVALYGTYTTPTDETIQRWVDGMCKKSVSSTPPHPMIDCCWQHSTHPDFVSFGVRRLYGGLEVRDMETLSPYLMRQHVLTYEDNPTDYVHEQLCGKRPANECWVELVGSGHDCNKTFTEMFVYSALSDAQPTVEMSDGTVNLKGANNTVINLPIYWPYHSDSTSIASYTTYATYTNPTDEVIQNWVSGICRKAADPSLGGKQLDCCSYASAVPGLVAFGVRRLYGGVYVSETHVVQQNGQVLLEQEVSTHEEGGLDYIRDRFCGNLSANDCWVVNLGQGPACSKTVTSALVYSVIGGDATPIQTD